MSRIGDIRAALATVLAGAAGVTSMLDYPPANIPSNGVGWLGFDTIEVTDSQRTVDEHTLPVRYCVNLASRHAAGLEATEPVIDSMRAVIRQNQRLGGLAHRVQVRRIVQGTFNEPAEFIGFEMTLQIKESYGVSFSA